MFLIGCMLLNGICFAVLNRLNLYLSGVVDSAVFFPIVNGGSLILTMIAAIVVFRERLTRKQWIGIVLGVLAVFFLCVSVI